jgi:methionyl-tRNA formyltransferase
MRVIVMGTGPFAVPSLQGLLERGHEIPFVVTRPAKLAQSKKPPPRPVAQWAQLRGIPLFEPTSINQPEAIARLRDAQADLFFVCDYGQILSKECLQATRLGGINLHGSLLPRHRGAAPVQWSLLAGDTETGVTVIHMTPRLDAGPELAVRTTPVLPDEAAGELEPRLAELGVEATLQAIDLLESWDQVSPIGTIQDHALATRAPRFSKHHGQLDFRLPAEYLVRLIRACQPWPGAYAQLTWPENRSVRILVKSARHLPEEPILPADAAMPQGLGAVMSLSGMSLPSDQLGQAWLAPWDQLLAVRTGAGWLLINRLQPAGKREMSAAEFLRGHPVSGDSRFELPPEPVPMLQA